MKLFGTVGLWISCPFSELIYLISIFVIGLCKSGHFPRCLDDLLFLGKDFADTDDSTVFDYTVHSVREACTYSSDAMTFCRKKGIDRRKSVYVTLVSEEILMNIFEHNSDGRKCIADIAIRISGESIIVCVRDYGSPFNPKERIHLLDDAAPEHNIGLRLISRIAKDMDYVRIFNLNQFMIEL